MEEKYLNILKMALKIGANAISEVDKIAYCYEDIRNDYFNMVMSLAEKLNINLDDIF